MSDAFFLPLGGDRYEATSGTSGPWDPGLQHAGPPAALLARALEPGRAVVWTRLRGSVVAGEEPSGLQRAMAVADSGNGVSALLDMREWWFINPELTVHLVREPRGEWICLDAATTIEPGGAGLAASVLSDRDGPVARGAQTLWVAPRPVSRQSPG